MKEFQIENILPTDFSDSSRVWIFQSNRAFSEREEEEMNEQLQNFYMQWKSHGDEVKGWAKILLNQFVVVLADVKPEDMGGCSTDSMMRVIKSFEKQYQVDLFDRQTITFLVKGKAEPLPLQQVKYALENGYIETDSLLFNNLVDTKAKLQSEWLVPLNKSWLWNRIVN